MQQIHTGRAANGHAGHQERKDAEELIMQVALKLYGEPNKAFSRAGELRFGTRGSLSVDLKRNVWFDHEHGVGGGVLKLIEHRLGLKGAGARRWLAEQGLVLPRRTGIESVRGRLVATYDYCEADGTIRYQVLRYEPKCFKQRRPGQRVGDPPIYRLDGVEPLPYRLPEVTEAIAREQPIVVVEWEKDCDNLAVLGIVSSCNSGGANKWPECITPYFRDADIIIIGDNDDAGRKHVGKVAAALAPVAASVRVLDLTAHWPECPHKGDISGWLAAGGTREQLDVLLEKAKPWLGPAGAKNGDGKAETHQSHQTHQHGAWQIQLRRGERARVLSEVLALIRERGELFERGGELVRVTPDGIEPVCDDWLLGYLDLNAAFTGFRNGVEEPRDAPPWLPRRIIAKKGEQGLPRLRAVISAPTMRADGTLLVEPGYDVATGLYLLSGTGRPLVPQTPTQAELKAAAARLWLPYAQFPFVNEAARSVMVAAIFTAVVRRTLPLSPAFAFDAPSSGTGKTLLGYCLLALCGMPRQAIPDCRNEEETRKRLLSALRSGQPCILLDNIRGRFGSAALEAMLTTEVYSDRLLGGSTMLALPTNALILISGNNFLPAGDLWRRLLTIRIDAGVEAPERRTFDIDPFEHCRDHRQDMVVAALTLLRGFVAEGSPRITGDKLASFENWDDRIRQAVIWIGERQLMPEAAPIGDPIDAMEQAKNNEPERQILLAMLHAVRAVKGAERWHVRELIEKVEAAQARDDGSIPILREVLDDIAGAHGNVNPRKLGRWIERHADRRCEGMCITRAGERSHTAFWRIEGEPSGGA